MTLSTRAVGTAIAAGLIAATAYLGLVPMILASLVLVTVLAGGWARVAGQPKRGGTAIVVGMAGYFSLAAAGLTQTAPVLRFVTVVIAMAVALAFVAEMLRQDGRLGLVSSVAASVTGAVIAAGLSGWVAAARSGPGIALVITAALALVLAAGVVALPIQPGWLAAVLTIWLAAGVGLLAGHLLPETNWDLGLIVGTVAGITMATLRVLLTNDHRYRQPLVGLAAAIAPAAIFGILVYAISWIVL